MKKLLFAAFIIFKSQLGYSQVSDGIYVIPALDAYALLVSQGNLAKFYLFWLDGRWTTGDGSRVGDSLHLAQVTDKDVAALKVTGGGLGATIEQLYCNPYPEDSIGGCDDDPVGVLTAIPVLKANGALKAVYQTQWGADVVVFDSDGIAVMLLFEYGSNTSDRAWIGAYTAELNNDLTISDLTVVVEADVSDQKRMWFGGDSAVSTRFTIQINNLLEQQAEVGDFVCSISGRDSSEKICAEMKEKYFSSFIRKF